jgi:hypothetical protein|tara:strand:+ start:313 stop:474 length:162 start_codon:yes stop_codon:yes gene_type:complete
MKVDTSVKIKGQGSIPMSQPKDVKVEPRKPGFGKGKSRGKGAALRGNKFNGIY